jgi:hypothetical protein
MSVGPRLLRAGRLTQANDSQTSTRLAAAALKACCLPGSEEVKVLWPDSPCQLEDRQQ